MQTIGIIGIGFVGTALKTSFLKKNIHIATYDKYKQNEGAFDKCLTADIIFLCLPTPFCDERKEYNKDAIYEIMRLLDTHNYKGVIAIKSTIEPLICATLSKQYPSCNIVHNPEFLSAKTAYQDFHNQKHIVLGKTPECNEQSYNCIINFYKEYYPQSQISLCTTTESESMKLFVNSFYASKIQLFNEFYSVCQKIDINYDTVKNLMLKNNWINPTHTSVPGTDGQLSYGGACFPKDTESLLEFMKKNSSKYEVLNAVIKERNLMRN
jgi:nucleotide sugar dehydrogenase